MTLNTRKYRAIVGCVALSLMPGCLEPSPSHTTPFRGDELAFVKAPKKQDLRNDLLATVHLSQISPSNSQQLVVQGSTKEDCATIFEVSAEGRVVSIEPRLALDPQDLNSDAEMQESLHMPEDVRSALGNIDALHFSRLTPYRMKNGQFIKNTLQQLRELTRISCQQWARTFG